MSIEAVESVIGKAILDAEFRTQLFAEPDKVLARFDLTDAEKAQLKSVNRETLNVLGSALDPRISKNKSDTDHGHQG
jgi:hypothetical protein